MKDDNFTVATKIAQKDFWGIPTAVYGDPDGSTLEVSDNWPAGERAGTEMFFGARDGDARAYTCLDKAAVEHLRDRLNAWLVS